MTQSVNDINEEWAQMTFPPPRPSATAPNVTGAIAAASSTGVHTPRVTAAAAAVSVVDTVVSILARSRGVYEGYTSPLGIGFIVFGGGDYKAGHGACAPATRGPGDGPDGQVCPTSPGVAASASASRAARRRRDLRDLRGGLDHYWVDPCSNYGLSNYSSYGLGCDRTTTGATGTGYAGLYAAGNRATYNDPDKCPVDLLLWFHNLPWTYPMPKPANYTPADGGGGGGSVNVSGGTVALFDYIRFTHEAAVKEAESFAKEWMLLKGMLDATRFEGVSERFAQQVRDAATMRDSIMLQYSNWYPQQQPRV